MKQPSLLAGLFVLLFASVASAVPATVSFSGRLATSQGPVTGSVNLTFQLFPAPTGGTAVWTETQLNVAADQGLVFVELGSQTTLDHTVLNGNKLYLEITVAAETLSPRVAINSVPYAVQTETANTLGGAITAADVVTEVTGTNGLSALKTGNTVALALSTTGCSDGQVLKLTSGLWACGTDATGSATGSAPISVSAATISLTNCAAGQIYKMNAGGTAWGCAGDSDTTYTAGSGLTLTGTTFSTNPAGFAEAPSFAAAAGNTEITSATPVDVISTTMTPPVNGTVLVTAAADLFCSGCTDATTATSYEIWITNASGGAPINPRLGRLAGGASVSLANIPQFFAQQTFAVTGGVAVTFFLRAEINQGTTSLRVLRPSIAATFYPQ